jgi:hypothetical protein
MDLPSKALFVGFVYSMVWKPPNGESRHTGYALEKSDRPSSGGSVLVISRDGRSLWSIPLDKSCPTQKGLKLNAPSVKLANVGKLDMIEYTAKNERGKYQLYIHDFDVPLELFGYPKTKPRIFGAKATKRFWFPARGFVH